MVQRFAHGFLTAALIVALLPAAARALEPSEIVVDEPYFGDALFDFYRQNYVPALIKLETSAELGRLGNNAEDAALMKGGILLTWGQHEAAADIFSTVLDVSDDPVTRDRAWIYLGKVQYQRGYYAEAENSLKRSGETLGADLVAEKQQMLGSIYIAGERYAEAAALLNAPAAATAWRNYALFNQGVALTRQGEFDRGIALLDEAGRVEVQDEETAALRDRANLAIGLAFLQQENPAAARSWSPSNT